ncbi:SHOCT domain-containing protein [Hoeflea sp.]|uniref:SHOCT domain-containing protein n=1 Tax=Hoeflea sp. TaxID=1940281 RepID=UPI0019A71B1B|nr:SHOCT domain-containing protein [Hoeflea sp.]MBC7281325.1 SHOCT domain-containing protein [Hoeflea sp.]
MTELTEPGRQALAQIASRHGVSEEAAEHVLMALVAGQGTLAQFSHPELGGMGQWSMGGMTMVGDMFNTTLKAKVDAICTDVAELMRQSSSLHLPSAFSSRTQSQGDGVSLFVSQASSGNWWPGDLGQAASTGAQNRMRYAWFPETRRLAIDSGDGAVKVYDTGDHRIGGFSQQQSGDQSLSFSSQRGLVKLSDLREVDVSGSASDRPRTPKLSEALQRMPSGASARDKSAQQPERRDPPSEPAPVDMPEPSHPAAAETGPAAAETGPAAAETGEESDVFAKIERLAALHAKGILTDGEYQAKKAELLARI